MHSAEEPKPLPKEASSERGENLKVRHSRSSFNAAQGDKPWFLQLGFPSPHPPFATSLHDVTWPNLHLAVSKPKPKPKPSLDVVQLADMSDRTT